MFAAWLLTASIASARVPSSLLRVRRNASTLDSRRLSRLLGRRGEQAAGEELEARLAGGVRDGDLAPPLPVSDAHPRDQKSGLASRRRLHPHVTGGIHGPILREGAGHGRHALAEGPELGVDPGRHVLQGRHAR